MDAFPSTYHHISADKQSDRFLISTLQFFFLINWLSQLPVASLRQGYREDLTNGISKTDLLSGVTLSTELLVFSAAGS